MDLLEKLEASGLEVADLRDLLPTNPDVPFETRSPKVLNGGVIHHTAGWRKATAKGLADFHIEKRHFPGLAYTFYIKWPDGAVDWCLEFGDVGWQTKNHNLESFGIALAGNYKDEEPPEPMIESLAILITVLKDCFPQELWFQPHYALRPTVCPGKVWKAYIAEEQK